MVNYLRDRPDYDNVAFIDQSAIPAICEMSRNGMRIDRNYFLQVGEELRAEQSKLQFSIYEKTGYEFNLKSKDQLYEVLHDYLCLDFQKIKSTKSGNRHKLDNVALLGLQNQHDSIGTIMEYNKITDLLKFIDRIPTLADHESRVHSNYSQTRVPTGRLASSNPNLQNIPIRGSGKRVRGGFVASPGNVLISVDGSQIQLCIAAHCSGDPTLCSIINDGIDPHSYTAYQSFHKALPLKTLLKNPQKYLSVVDKEKERKPSKNLNFGILFGITAPGLMDLMRESGCDMKVWTEVKCQNFIIEWFGIYPRVARYMDTIERRLKQYGFTWDMVGRVFHLEGIRSSIKRIRQEVIRQALNYSIQSGEQAIIKLAMPQILTYLKTLKPRTPYGAHLLNQVHDELLIESEERLAPQIVDRVCSILSSTLELLVPIRTGSAIGLNWMALSE